LRKKKLVEVNSFVKELAKDVNLAKKRMDDDPCDSNIREFVRTTYAAIEAQSWNIRMYLLDEIIDKKKISTHEISALKEEVYVVTDKGEIKVQSRGYPLKVSLKLIINTFRNHGILIETDYSSPEWSNIDDVSRIRNRITHPKNMSDIIVSKKEAEKCFEVFLFVQSILLNSILFSLNKIFSDLKKTYQHSVKIKTTT
jgi:hypothetical protein